jgi:hypothetical protein
MTWQDLDEATSLERELLRRALPLAPTVGRRSSSSILDQATGAVDYALTFEDSLGPDSAAWVERLGIRPLLVGAAWKVLDLLFEETLRLGGEPPNGSGRWTIEAKRQLAQRFACQPAAIEHDVWRALCQVYVETIELRHSLVHRQAYVTATGDLVGMSRGGIELRPFTADQQDAFARAVQLAATVVTEPSPDNRTRADLSRQLYYLSDLHDADLPPVALGDVPDHWTVIVEAVGDATNMYALDLALLRSKVSIANVDVTVRFPDRLGQDLRGRLEEAPACEVVMIEPNNPPPWLK